MTVHGTNPAGISPARTPASARSTPRTPLFDGFKGVFGEGTAAELLALIGLVGLIASFFTIIYAYGRNTYSLSRAGYFPKWLSVTHGKRNTPHVALIAGAVAGRKRLVLSPEEEFALTSGEHGHPETEGYGSTHVTDIPAADQKVAKER